MEFIESEHKYVHNGEEYVSVTTLLSEYFSKFDADEIIEKYYDYWQRDYLSPYFSMSKEEIKQKLDSETKLGTFLHKHIRNYLKHKKIPKFTELDNNLDIEFSYFLDFLDNTQNLEFISSELIVFDEHLKVAGTIDAVFYDKDSKSYVLVDWKRVKNLSKKTNNYAKPPIDDVKDCNFYKYALQLNFYRWLLAKQKNLRINSMFIVQLHNSNDNYKAYYVKDMSYKVKRIIKDHLKNGTQR